MSSVRVTLQNVVDVAPVYKLKLDKVDLLFKVRIYLPESSCCCGYIQQSCSGNGGSTGGNTGSISTPP